MELSILQIPPETKINSKTNIPLPNAENGEVERSKVGSLKSI